MDIFLTTLHVMACLVLVIVVLLQRGKGSDMGAMLGGGAANTVFGGRGAGNFLTKITSACAVIFMVTSLSLAYLTSLGEENLIFDGEEIEAPADAEILEEVPAAEVPAEPEVDASALEEITTPAADSEPIPVDDAR